MKTLPSTTTTVHLDSIGEISRSRWVGTFTIKCILSHADRFAKARMYAAMVPEKENLMDEEDRLKAEVIAQLSVRVIDGPEWFEATRGGQLMVDAQPLIDLLDLCKNAMLD